MTTEILAFSFKNKCLINKNEYTTSNLSYKNTAQAY